MSANQVQFTTSTKHITSGLGEAIEVIGVGFVRSNDVGSSSGVGVALIMEIGMGSSLKVSASGDLEDTKVCLGIMSATAVGLASS